MPSPNPHVHLPYPVRPLLWLLALISALTGLAQIVLGHWLWVIALLILAALLATVAGRIHPTVEEQNVLARTEDEDEPNAPH